MDKRYQVFISSTFTDLIEERMYVHKAVLELNHMPAGMELFPSADSDAWNLIQEIIDESDYYILVIGGKYGSQDDSGVSFTEKEYDYAYFKKKPVIAILNESPDLLPRNKTETENATWEKLSAFRKKVEKRHTCTYWKSSDDLKAKAIVGLTSEIKKHPAAGWIKADRIPLDATVSEILNLRKKISELEEHIKEDIYSAPIGSEDLQQGDDEFKTIYSYKRRDADDIYPYAHDIVDSGKVEISWNALFAFVAPEMVDEANKGLVTNNIRTIILRYARYYAQKEEKNIGKKLVDFDSYNDDVNTIIIQFRALGYIQESRKSRSVKDKQTYWKLTPYGDKIMTQLVAVRRNRKNDELPNDEK